MFYTKTKDTSIRLTKYINKKKQEKFDSADKRYQQKRDYEKTTLTLVTCTNNDSKTQTVYIAYLEKQEEI